ncbi:MAG: class I SAM-dependent methyltransferase [Planctomycetota bacterium]|jgi:16S rRNA (guanine(1405)-N(7))-methyltransferase
MSDAWPIPVELLRREAERVSARYRLDVEEAMEALARAFAQRPELARRIRERHQGEDVTRWRDYKEILKRCRKEIYYRLRRYYADPAEVEQAVAELEREVEGPARAERIEQMRQSLLAAHASTRERLPCYGEFYDRFFSLVGVPSSILDVGCGMHPLSYPFQEAGAATERYVALDRDARAVRALSAYARAAAPGRLLPRRASPQEPGWAEGPGLAAPFELALMLKVVPVLNRLDREGLSGLETTPAERVLLTGSVESMTRRDSIEARERGVLLRFVEQCGRRVVGEFRAGSEFGYLVE